MKPRVLHIAPFLWSGAGNVVTRLCLSQLPHWRVAIVTSGTSKGLTDWPDYRRQLTAEGIPHHAIDFFDRSASTFWTSVRTLERLVSRWRPHVVHTHAGVPACAAAAVLDSSSHRFRHINHVYNWGAHRPGWMNTMDLSGIRRSDRVACSAKTYRDLLLRRGVPPRRIAYVPWGLDLDAIRARATAPERQRRGAHGAGPRIGCVGRIEPRKGQLELVHGFARLLADASGKTLELVGPVADPAYAAQITNAIRELGISGAVQMTGKVRNPYQRLARWDLFVSLSSDEGQGLAILEAMALGVPVLARSVAGVEDYLVNGVNGWACSRGSSRAVADDMRRVLVDPGRPRIVAGARRMVDRRYTWKRTVDAIERLYTPHRRTGTQDCGE